MRTSERLRGLKQWVYENLCQGREMKTPSPDMDITKICRQEPRVYLGWTPTRPDETGLMEPDPLSVCPGILIMPAVSYSKYVEEKRFDRYNKISRAQEMGSELAVNILFSVYEPGVRLPGFVESADDSEGLDMTKFLEGTEEGLFTLTNWMDDCVTGLLTEKMIPHTDLFLNEASMTYNLLTDSDTVVDKRPIFYGFINCKFMGYADEHVNNKIDDLLK